MDFVTKHSEKCTDNSDTGLQLRQCVLISHCGFINVFVSLFAATNTSENPFIYGKLKQNLLK